MKKSGIVATEMTRMSDGFRVWGNSKIEMRVENSRIMGEWVFKNGKIGMGGRRGEVGAWEI